MYIPGAVTALWDLGVTDQRGEVKPLNLPPGTYEVPRVSPDGRRIAFGTDDGKEAIVWTHELSGALADEPLTCGRNNRFPTWSSDSKPLCSSPTATATAASSGSLSTEARRTRLTKPDAGEAHEPEIVVSKRRHAAVQRDEGLRRVAVDALADGQEADALW